MSTQEDLPSVDKRRIGCMTQVFVAIVCLATITLLSVFVWRHLANKRVNAALANLKAANHPTTADELRATYQLPTGLNPGPLLVEAGNAMDVYGPAISKLPFIGGEASDPVMPGEDWDQLEPARAFLAKHAGSLATIQRAARAKSLARYEGKLVWDSPKDASSHISYDRSHRQICRIMGLAAYVHEHDGDLAGVVESIRTSLRVALSLSDEPKSMGQLLGTACVSNSLGLLQDFISLDFSDDQLSSLQATLRRFQPQKSLLRGLQGETVFVVSNLRNPRMVGPFTRSEDAAFYVETMLPLLQSVETGDWQKILVADAAMNTTLLRLKTVQASAVRYALAGQALPGASALVKSKVRVAAQVLVYDALLAARRFQLENGRLPKSLGELVPDYLPQDPIDPYSQDGATLLLAHRADDSSIVIYSLGPNGDDDGGDGGHTKDGQMIDIAAELGDAKSVTQD